MAGRAGPLTAGLAGGLALAATLGPLAAVAWRAEGGAGGLQAADWAALRFTLMQAVLSALLTLALAVPLARALARRRFPGRSALVTLMGAPFLLPVVVGVLGLLAIFGRQGPVNQALRALGLPEVSIYGLGGILLAHVFFNLPLVTRLVLQGWQSIPAEQFRLAGSLGFGPREVLRQIELPMLRRVAPGAAMLVFLICLTSFAVVLMLGGGPKATTVELSIYQAFRFDFDLARAARLGALQLAIGLAGAGLALWLAHALAVPSGLDRPVERFDLASGRAGDALLIGLATLFLAAPLGAVLWRGLGGLGGLPASVWPAALRSVAVALAAGAGALALALPLALGAARRRLSLADLAGSLGLAASPLVLGTGLYILLYPVADPVALALPVTAVVNALMALPFALRALGPAARETRLRYGRLSESLGLTGLAALRLVILPRLRRQIGFALGLATALSMGDLGVVTLFADPERATLPMLMSRLMSAYRMDQAAAAGLVLVALSFGLFWILDLGGRGHADA